MAKTKDSFNNKKKKKASSDSGQRRLLENDVTSDFDPKLMGRTGSCNLKRMADSDPIIGGIITSYKNPVLSANWTIEEIPDATEEETKVRDLLISWFFTEGDFGTQLNSILDMLAIGFSVFEQYYTKYEFEGSSYMMPILDERVQQSIYKIDYEKEIVQQYDTDKNLVEIPFDDLVFFTFRKKGNDRRGVSLLRQSYYDYERKETIKEVGTKGIIRGLLGLPVGTLPETVNKNSQEYSDFEDLMIELGMRNDNGFSDSAVIPAGYKLDMLHSTFDLDKLKNYLAYLDSTMTISVLTQFLTLGQSGSGGSFSLGRDQSDMFLDGLQYVIDYIEDIYNNEIVKKAVLFNFPNVDATKFRLSGLNLNKKNNKEFAETLKVLKDGGYIKDDVQDEVMVRQMYNLPEIDLAEREKEQEEKVEVAKEEEVVDDVSVDVKTIKLSESWKTADEREDYIDQETKKITKYSRASLTLIAESLQNAIAKQLNKGEVEAQGLKNIQTNSISAFTKGLGKKLAGISKRSWNNAEKNSRNKIKLSELNPSELPSNVLTSFVINQADLTAEKMVNDLREAGLLAANTSASKGYSVKQSTAQAEEAMDKVINSNNINTGSLLSVVQSINYAEMEYYKSIEDDLWGYEFSNPDPVAQICKSTVGKTFQKDSLALTEMLPPLHFGCKSFYVPIYKSDPKYKEKPLFDNYIPPPSIMKEKTI